MSQTDLTKMVGVLYARIDRYEIKGAQPPAELLKKIAEVLDTTVNYLVSGDSDEKARTTLNDVELLQQFKAVQQMDDEDKRVIKTMIDAFITKRKVQQLAL
jgi:transcriptional regulator with XRE-family HTH domain